MSLTYTPDVALGTPCPDFNLPGVDGRMYSRGPIGAKRAALVMFICNHCPYVMALEDRLVALANEFIGKDVGIVAISANDVVKYPADSMPKMKERAEAKGYPFPYLLDESQVVARAFGAVCTPDFFLYDSALKLSYRGRFDDSWKDASAVRSQDLKNAIQTLLAGDKPDSNSQKPSIGCSIKWKV